MRRAEGVTHDTPNPNDAVAEAAAGPAVPAGTASRPPVASSAAQITSDKLFAGALEVQIHHHGVL